MIICLFLYFHWKCLMAISAISVIWPSSPLNIFNNWQFTDVMTAALFVRPLCKFTMMLLGCFSQWILNTLFSLIFFILLSFIIGLLACLAYFPNTIASLNPIVKRNLSCYSKDFHEPFEKELKILEARPSAFLFPCCFPLNSVYYLIIFRL